MSGGVDSSVAALLMLEQGLEVEGATLLLHGDSSSTEEERCGTETDIADAAAVCERLGIPHRVFDRRREFSERIMKSFVEVYASGGTPNPCVKCNMSVKFPEMLAAADMLGCEKTATGHYARVELDPSSGRWLLKRAKNRAKDQTYVLYALSQQVLSRLLLPLGSIPDKEYARRRAEAAGLVNSRKPDSQDICFIPSGNHVEFIEKFTGQGESSCRLVTEDGRLLGMGKGISAYTVGQRKGLGIALGEPCFVVAKRPESGEIVLGRSESLFERRAEICDCNFISVEGLTEPMRVTAKTRYSQAEAPAVIYPLSSGRVTLEFDEPQRAMTCGQSAVFYDGDIVVGGGIISSVG